MRNAVLILIIANLVLVAGSIDKTVTFSQNDLLLEKANNYDVVELKGYPALIEPGKPRLPRVVQSLVVPSDAIPTNVEIISVHWVDIPGEYYVYPAQPDIPLPMPGKSFIPEKEYDPDPAVYENSSPYPQIIAKVNGSGTMAGYCLAHVELYPVRYLPAEHRLQMATNIAYRLTYDQSGNSGVMLRSNQQQVFSEILKGLVANPEDLSFYRPMYHGKYINSMVPPGHYEYVVISAPPVDTVFQRLVDWKTKKGIPSIIVQVSWINSNYTGYDLQEKIRNFIIDAYANWGTVYVLLGGSGDYRTSGQNLVPTRKAWYTYAGGGDIDSMPADLYYADLDRDWDCDNDHVFGELSDSVDMYADVFVGRASVYNVSLAQNFVSKVLNYERTPPTDFIRRLMLPTAILWSSYEERPMQDSIARMPPSGWRISKMYERTGTLSRQGMIDTMNVGYNLGHWEGHGDENGIYMGSPYLTSTDADGLINGNKVGIAISIACMCGGWDMTPSGDCFAEHLVNRVSGGLTAVMMNSRYGWGAYVGGYVPGPSERIDTTFFANIFWQSMFHIGQVYHAAKDAWVPYADSGNQYDMTRWCIYELNLFGCPEMPIWSAQPMTLTVNYPGVIPIGNQNVSVTVLSSGTPVQNALVCLRKGTETYGAGYTNGSGNVLVTVNPLTPGPMDVTVTARNHYPFEDTLMVQASNYAYITYLKCSISDPAPGGNNNGQLNPGESAEIPLWVKNWGQSQGTSIIGTLRTGDSYTTLSDTVKNFGNVAPGDSAYSGSNGYNISIAGNCPNGHGILFTLYCHDNADSSWSSQFGLTVYAPVLTYQNHQITGGNGNGILDPGETANLIVTIENEGGAAASNVTSTLTTTSPWITINDNSGNYGTINPGNQANNSADPYVVTASSSTPWGTACDMSVIVNSGNYHDTLPFVITVGQMAPSDTGLYYAYWSGGPHSQCPVFSWIAIDTTQTTYPGTSLNLADDAVTQVNLPFTFRYYGVNYTQITVGSDGWIAMGYQTAYDQTNTNIPNSDGPSAMVAGLWDDLDPGNAGQPSDVYYYYDAPTHRFIIEYFRVEHWPSGNHETFEIILYDPAYYPTPTGDGEIIVQYLLAMHEADNTLGIENSTETVGIQYYFDGTYHTLAVPVTNSFAIKYTTYPPGYNPGIEEGKFGDVPLRTQFGIMAPNPFSGAVRIPYQIAIAGEVKLGVYDAAGRLVCRLAGGVHQPGFYQVTWKGLDDSGRSTPAGVYFVRLETDDHRLSDKIILLK